jgi:hypothetical protein
MVDRIDVPAGRAGDVVEPAGIFKRISWGAIIAGALIALAIQVMLLTLGAGVGLGMVSPAQGEGAPETLGTGAAIWWVIATLIALFAGGWVAAHLAGVVAKMDGALHGLVAWSLATVLGLAMLGTTLGALGGAAATDRQQGFSALVPQISQSFRQEAQVQRVQDRINHEADQLVRQGGKATGDDLDDAQEDVRDAVNEVLDDPSQDNRQAAIKALTDKTKLDQNQAQAKLDGWIRTYEQAKPEYREAGTPEARRAERVTTIASRTALATFVMLLLGAAAALVGGYVGSPSDYWEATHRHERTERTDVTR